MTSSRMVSFSSLGALYDGPHATPDRVTEGPHFLNISCLESGRLNLENSDRVSAEDFAIWTRRVAPEEDDLLFSYETRLGDAALMPGGVRACLGRRMALIRPDRSVIVPRYLLYLFLSPGFRAIIDRNTIQGATVNRISLSTMGEWEVPLPPVATQNAIAEVLGAIDDKVSANALLSETARSLTKALFVPVSAAARGDQQLADIADVTKGVPYRSVDLHRSDTALVTLKSVSRDGRYSERGLKAYVGRYLERQVVNPGDIVVAQTDLTQAADVVGRAVRVEGSPYYKKLVASLDLAIVRPRSEIPAEYLLAVLGEERFHRHCQSYASGTTVLHLNSEAFSNYRAPAVPFAAQWEFANRVRLLYELVESSARENRSLTALRDALLPQLISGSVVVKDAEKQVEAVM